MHTQPVKGGGCLFPPQPGSRRGWAGWPPAAQPPGTRGAGLPTALRSGDLAGGLSRDLLQPPASEAMTSPSPHRKSIRMPPTGPGPMEERLSLETALGSSAPPPGLGPTRFPIDLFKTIYAVLSLREELF